MAKQSKIEKAIDKRVEKAYYASCSGIQVNMMDIGKIFNAGRVACANGASEDELKTVIRAFVETIRMN